MPVKNSESSSTKQLRRLVRRSDVSLPAALIAVGRAGKGLAVKSRDVGMKFLKAVATVRHWLVMLDSSEQAGLFAMLAATQTFNIGHPIERPVRLPAVPSESFLLPYILWLWLKNRHAR
jgi:hypothetical protein